jgi:hypothetical protein
VKQILFTDEELASVERGASMFVPPEERAVAGQLKKARAFLRYVVDARMGLDISHILAFLRESDPEWIATEAARRGT